jgi:hypothetical protein
MEPLYPEQHTPTRGNRAARFVYNNFYDREPGVVISMISRLQWESLEQRRAKARATFMYKIVNNLVDVHAEHILTPSDNRTRGNAAYRTLYTNADVYRYSFFPHTIITWNTIPPTLRHTSRSVPGRVRVHHPTSAILDVNTFIPFLTVKKGHVRRVNIQYRVFS